MATAPAPVPEFSGPYIGPQPFRREDANLFFGRIKESDDLLSLVTAHGEVLLYAQSGAGKTSLLNAGLIPLLEAKAFNVLPPARVGGPLPEGISPGEIKNLYVFNALRTWTSEDRSLQDLAGRSFRRFNENRERPCDSRGRQRVTVMILDQFEEIFQYYPEQWEMRKNFFDQLGETVEHDLQLRIVFAMREDYIAQLTPFCRYLPEQLKTRYRLERLKADAALAAVVGPLGMKAAGHTFGPGVAEKLVHELLKERVVTAEDQTVDIVGQYVEPVHLQVVCGSLWQNLPPGVSVISEEHLAAFGDVTRSLSKFYDTCVQRTAACTGVKEGALRTWIADALITRSGTRSAYCRGQVHGSGIPNAALDLLVALHLVRVEHRSGAAWYELNHDRLIEPIQQSNKSWLLSHGATLEPRDYLEARARAWAATDRRDTELLSDVELQQAEQLLNASEEIGLPCSPVLRELVSLSRFERDRTAAEQLRRAKEVCSRELAAAAIANSMVDPELGVLLALQADTVMRTPESLESLYQAVRECRTKYIFQGRGGPLHGVAFSPDGRMIATGGHDAIVRICDAGTGRELRAFKGHSASIYGIAFSFDSARLATTGLDGTLKVWDVETGQRPVEFAGHEQPTIGVAFSSDGRWVITGSFDQTASLWDAWTGERILTLSGHSAPVVGAAISRDGRYAATASLDGTARLWDATSGETLRSFSHHPAAVYGVAFSPRGSRIATSSLDQTACIWGLETGRLLLRLKGHAAMLGMVTYSADGKRLATASADGTAKIWDANSGNELLTLTGHKGPVFGIQFAPHGQDVATASWDGTARLWNASTGRELIGHAGEIKNIAFCSFGDRIATVGADRLLKIWDVSSGREVLSVAGHKALIYDVDFSPDGNWVATGSLDRTVKIWDSATGRLARTIRGHDGPIFGVAFAPGNVQVATASGDRTAKLWDFVTGQLLLTLSGHLDLVYRVCFSPDGSRVFTASADGSARIWDSESGKEIRTLRAHAGMVCSVKWSPNGEVLATAGSDGTARLWSAGTGALIRTLNAHISSVNEIAFDQSGLRLATASSDRTARVWDVPTGECLIALRGNRGIVNSVGFSPDGRQVASAGADHVVHLDVLEAGELKEIAKRCALRDFSADEREKYLSRVPLVGPVSQEASTRR